jgi:hypothetical protein
MALYAVPSVILLCCSFPCFYVANELGMNFSEKDALF